MASDMAIGKDIIIDGAGAYPSQRLSSRRWPGPTIGMNPTGISERRKKAGNSHAAKPRSRLWCVQVKRCFALSAAVEGCSSGLSIVASRR
jgi:hypothetical protein